MTTATDLMHSNTSCMAVPQPRARALLAGALAGALFPLAGTAHAATAANIADDDAAAADADADAAERGRQIIVRGMRAEDANPNANPNAPYKVETSSNEKFTEPLRDTPKSVTVIPKEVIEDIGATSFREVVRSTPGVTLGTGEGGNAFGDRIFIRGFEARNDVYIDGLRDPGVSSREIFAVEQIEVIKGPSGNFGGRGTTGGLVSLESKQPWRDRDYGIVEGAVGTENFYRATADANVTLGDRAALRVNALYHNADTPGRDFITSERYGVAVAGVVDLTDTLSLNADYYHYRLDGIPDFGHPFDSTTLQPYRVNRNNNYGVIGRDFLENGADVATLRLDFKPIDAISIRSVTRYGKTFNRYLVGTPGTVCRVARTAAGACPANGAAVPESEYTLTAGSQRRWSDNEYWANVTDATLRLDTGGISHTLVLGGEYAHETVSTLPLNIAAFAEDASGNPIATPGSFIRNLLNPNPVLGFTIPVTPDRTNGPTEVTIETLSAYIIDTIKLSPAVQLLLSARYDSYALDYLNPDSSTAAGLQPLALRNNSAFLNYQASLVVKPSDPLTLYASFATSSNPSGEQLDGNGIAYDGIAASTQNLEPERNRSYELGFKWELNGSDLLLTGAVYQITKANAREQTSPNVYQLVGEQRARGVELGITGNITDRLQLFGGYSYNDARIVDSVTAANIGRRLANTPQHSASLLATYAVTDHLQIGGQIYYQDEIFGGSTAANTAKVPGYVRYDAVVRWQPLEKLQVRLNVLNITDKTYYDAIYRSNAPFAYIAPGRSATLTVSYSL